MKHNPNVILAGMAWHLATLVFAGGFLVAAALQMEAQQKQRDMEMQETYGKVVP